MTENKKNKSVLVGMSGGVDSSVAAALLIEQGYNVIGGTMKVYNYEDFAGKTREKPGYHPFDNIRDAESVCRHLGIPHHTLDVTDLFDKHVVSYFIDEYLKGSTPNPCVTCNRKVKWSELLRKADELGVDYVATGHYANIRRDTRSGRYIISKGTDKLKDQSYAMWRLSQEFLSRTIFPLGQMKKEEVRQYAENNGLETANKSDSFEICFIPDNDYKRFLKDKVEGLEERVSGGDIIMSGKVIGKHKGYPFYTIGQRKGLGISAPEPVYVIKIDYRGNIVEVGKNPDLMHSSLLAKDVNPVKYKDFSREIRVLAKIRYKDEGGMAVVSDFGDGRVIVDFDEPRRAITSGQSVVFYEDEDVVGGGIIDRVVTVK